MFSLWTGRLTLSRRRATGPSRPDGLVEPARRAHAAAAPPRGRSPDVAGRSLVDTSTRSLATPLARALGVCAGPVVVPLPMVGLAAAYGDGPLAWRDAGLFLLFLTVLPAALVLVARRLGW